MASVIQARARNFPARKSPQGFRPWESRNYPVYVRHPSMCVVIFCAANDEDDSENR